MKKQARETGFKSVVNPVNLYEIIISDIAGMELPYLVAAANAAEATKKLRRAVSHSLKLSKPLKINIK